jgi:hypothetical protein
MKKLLIGIPAALLIFVVGSKLYYSYQLDKNMGLLTSKLALVGVDATYKNANVTFGGDIQVEGLFFQHPSSYLSVSVDKAAINTGSIFAVNSVLNDLKHGFLPAELGLEVSGARLPISLLSDSDADPLDLPLVSTPSCGNGSAIAQNQWPEVGYSYLDFKTAQVNYQIIGSGQQINLQVVNDITDMYRTSVAVQVSLGASSRSMRAIAAAAPNASLLGFNLDYQDLGLNANIDAYCQANTELELASIREGQLSDWQDAWRLQGLKSGPAMAELYQEFLQNPGSVSVAADAIGSVKASEINTEAPLTILARFNATASVNRRAAVELDLTKMSADQALQWRRQYMAAKFPAEQKDIEVNLHREKKVYLEVSELPQYLNQPLTIETQTGKTVHGIVLSLNKDDVQIQVNHGGGYIIRPVEYPEIAKIYRTINSKR